MKREQLPNALTIGRIILAVIFFALLAVYQNGCAWGPTLLNVALGVYAVAAATDVLDGHLARRWNATSAFGRMIDPIVDKVLVVGALTMLAGRNFSFDGGCVGAWEQSLPAWLTGQMASGVQAWMVVAVLTREFVVSGVRGYSESRGKAFPATKSGKIKMALQSAAVCFVLVQLANFPTAAPLAGLKIVLIWSATVVTAFSGLVYLGRAKEVLMLDERSEG